MKENLHQLNFEEKICHEVKHYLNLGKRSISCKPLQKMKIRDNGILFYENIFKIV